MEEDCRAEVQNDKARDQRRSAYVVGGLDQWRSKAIRGTQQNIGDKSQSASRNRSEAKIVWRRYASLNVEMVWGCGRLAEVSRIHGIGILPIPIVSEDDRRFV